MISYHPAKAAFLAAAFACAPIIAQAEPHETLPNGVSIISASPESAFSGGEDFILSAAALEMIRPPASDPYEMAIDNNMDVIGQFLHQRAPEPASMKSSTEAPKPEPEPELERHAEVKSAPAKPSGVPEITLDKQIQAKIEEAAEAIKKTEARAAAKAAADAEADRSLDLAATSEHKAIELPSKPAARPAVDPEPAKPAAQPEKPTAGVTMPETTEVEAEPAAAPEAEEPDEEFRQIAANLARAKTIDDVDDKMAETLFGEQFSAIAAQVAAKAAAHLSANDDVGGEANAQPEAAPKPKRNGASPPQGNGKPPRLPEAPGLDESASRRLATVRALNNGERTPNPVPNAVAAAKTAESAERTPARPTPAAAEQPRSIEEQINTSMTQTLQALSVKRPVAADDDDKDDDDEKGGFFSRFRKS